ncbi:MAG: hypothetical protein V1809_04005 [Planctomycetota bacterium]
MRSSISCSDTRGVRETLRLWGGIALGAVAFEIFLHVPPVTRFLAGEHNTSFNTASWRQPQRWPLPDPIVHSRQPAHWTGTMTFEEGAVNYRTNRDGYRFDDIPEDPPAGELRIAVIGNSFTTQCELPETDTYIHVAEHALRTRHGIPGARILNFGTNNAPLPQFVQVMRHDALRYRPRLVVMAIEGFDSGWPGESVTMGPDGRISGFPEKWPGRPLRPSERILSLLEEHIWTLRAVAVTLTRSRLTPSDLRRRWMPPPAGVARRQTCDPAPTLRIAALAAEKAERDGARLAISLHPIPPAWSGSREYFGTDPGIATDRHPGAGRARVWDLRRRLDTTRWQTWTYRSTNHYNAAGSRLLGEALAEKIAGILRETEGPDGR